MPTFQSKAGRTVTTLHGRQDFPDMRALYAGFPEMPLISISNAQRTPIPNANIIATVYHGLPANLLEPTWTGLGERPGIVGISSRRSDVPTPISEKFVRPTHAMTVTAVRSG